jgi:signal transduction histidine kinase
MNHATRRATPGSHLHSGQQRPTLRFDKLGRFSIMNVSVHPFLDGFAPAARAELMAAMVHERHPHGTYLFQEGDVADGIYLVLEGAVEIILPAGKQQRILSVISAGDYLGEVAVLDGGGRSTAARAKGSLSIAKVPRQVLVKILATEPGTLTLGLFRHVLSNLRNANDFVVSEVVQKEKLSLVGEMASSLMHDLRNPVTCIQMAADLLNATYPEQPAIDLCDRIRLQCGRLSAMASDLMDFSRGESKLSLGKTTTDAFLSQFGELHEDYLASVPVQVEFKTESAEITIDIMRLHRVLQNLITNAVEALGPTPAGRINVHARVEHSAFHLNVADNGPGIPQAIHDRIFEPFVTHGKTGGIGLGMSIVRNIVTAHGGTIFFESAPHQGTQFFITIPQST